MHPAILPNNVHEASRIPQQESVVIQTQEHVERLPAEKVHASPPLPPKPRYPHTSPLTQLAPRSLTPVVLLCRTSRCAVVSVELHRFSVSNGVSQPPIFARKVTASVSQSSDSVFLLLAGLNMRRTVGMGGMVRSGSGGGAAAVAAAAAH